MATDWTLSTYRRRINPACRIRAHYVVETAKTSDPRPYHPASVLLDAPLNHTIGAMQPPMGLGVGGKMCVAIFLSCFIILIFH
jgi:hypothetical protein